ncbi:MAG: radical SAM protein [Candidatus Hodarchaeota archaeon]
MLRNGKLPSLEEIGQFSIYKINNENANSVLAFLAGDKNCGWNAQRNLLKGLNHLNLLRRKEEIAERLLLHNTKTLTSVFERNYQLLADHQRKQVTTKWTIEQISKEASLSNEEVTALLLDYISLGHLEFHPSDICNLRCKGCTYGHDTSELKPDRICFPFNKLENLAFFRPKSILLSGGGEPTLYSDSNSGERYNFKDLVLRIKELMPNVRLALVTNGTHFVPESDWIRHLDWIRVSIDAATPETYGKFRGKKEFFDRVIDNLLTYLNFPIKYVGASFLYSQANISEYVAFAKKLYELVSDKAPQHLHKFNLQYRPLRKDPKDEKRDFPEQITEKQIMRVVSAIIQFADSSPDVEKFLRDQTNIEAVLGGNSHPPHDFSRCFYSQVFHIVRANGEIRPCFIRVTEPDFKMGNVLKYNPKEISLNSLYIAARRKKYCDPYGCRQCHVNYLLEAGLNGKIKPSKMPAVANDAFF